MKKCFTLPFLLLLAVAAQSQTYVSGFINANTTWNMAGSPYIVNGNALLSSGYTLTIDPGVVVKFDTNRTLQIDGELHAIGTVVNRITFTSLKGNPQVGDWGKLHFSDTCVDAVFDTMGNYISGCIMKYCDVSYGGGIGSGEIHIESSSPYLSHCRITYSSVSGVLSSGASYVVDSSLITNCSSFGLYFDYFSKNHCGLIIRGDTLQNNSGGIFLGYQSSSTCQTIIENNYFITNTPNGAITAPNSSIISNITIKENYFNGNTGMGSYASGVIHFENVQTDTIQCNVFLNNITNAGVIDIDGGVDCIITHNIIENNNSSSGNSVINYGSLGAHGYMYFSFNTVRSNSSSGKATCNINIDQSQLNNNNQLVHIDHNQFQNNVSSCIIQFKGPQINNSANNFMYLKYNNFENPNSQYVINNGIPYGSPNIYADSNYWGSTNTQHIDSVIYDYFDYGNLSVVYYQPILTHELEIDTTCPASFSTFISEKKNVAVVSSTFPNPFSTYTEITLGKELKDASLLLFNVYGQKVREITAINGKHISLRREALPAGIYIYEITEKGERIANGKLVAE